MRYVQGTIWVLFRGANGDTPLPAAAPDFDDSEEVRNRWLLVIRRFVRDVHTEPQGTGLCFDTL